MALHETSLPLVATVLTLTLEVSGEELGPGRSEAEALGLVASVAGPGTSAGQGPLSAVRGGVSEVGPTEGTDEPGAVATAVPAVLSPWERFVLGLDEALEELERQGAGGSMGPSEPVDRPDSTPGPGVPAPGGGSGLRSIPERPPAAERESTDVPMPASRTGAIDAAIARLATDRAADELVEIDRPAFRPAKDEPGLATVCLAGSLLAAQWGRPQWLAKRLGFAPVRAGSPVRRRRHVII